MASKKQADREARRNSTQAQGSRHQQNSAVPEQVTSCSSFRRALVQPQSLPPRDLLRIQSMIGNRALTRVLSNRQALQPRSEAVVQRSLAPSFGNSLPSSVEELAKDAKYWHPDWDSKNPEDIENRIRVTLAEFDGPGVFVFDDWQDLINYVRGGTGKKPYPKPNVPPKDVGASADSDRSDVTGRGDILSLGRVQVYSAAYHDEGFKRNKLKDAGRGEGRGSDLVECDDDGVIRSLGKNIFQAAWEKARGDSTFPRRLFYGNSLDRYFMWLEKNGERLEALRDKDAQKPKSNPRGKPICPACAMVIAPPENCGKCGQAIDWSS